MSPRHACKGTIRRAATRARNVACNALLVAVALAVVACSRPDGVSRDVFDAAPASPAPSGAIHFAFPTDAKPLPEQALEVPTKFGPGTTHISAALAANAGYTVQWSEFPAQLVAEQTADKILSGAMQVAHAGPHVTPIESSVATNGVVTWQRVVFRDDDDKLRFHDLRATMRGTRLYVVMVSGVERVGIEDDRAKAFFASVSITP